MKYSVPAVLVLVIVVALAAGCSGSQAPAAATTVAPAPAEPAAGSPAAAAATPQPSFSLGDHYLQKSYSFQTGKDAQSEQFRVDSPAWGIDIVVLPLNDDQQKCWFALTVTNMDTGKTETYGYGGSYSYEKHQQFPMYVAGPYKIEMTGNLVKVDVTAAKRNP
jgi:hypothetical protein